MGFWSFRPDALGAGSLLSTRSGRGQGLRVSGGEEPGHDAGVTERRRGTRIEHGRSLATTGRWSGDELPGPAGVGSGTKVELDDLPGLPSNSRGRHGQLLPRSGVGVPSASEGSRMTGLAEPGQEAVTPWAAPTPSAGAGWETWEAERPGRVPAPEDGGGGAMPLMANTLLTWWGC